MRLDLLHRRLAVGMGMAGLLAFAGGAGVEPLSAALAGMGLLAALFWQPSAELSRRLERVWLPVAAVLVVRALLHVFVVGGDVVVPVVDLLLLLLCAEALRSLETSNDARLYALSFALLLAATAYRPGVLFAVAFVLFVAVATLALTVGQLRRKAARYRVREMPLGPAFLWSTVGASGIALLVSAGVFLTFPRVSRAWAGRGDQTAGAMAGFADEVSLAEHGARIRGNPRIVLRVEFPEGVPGRIGNLHWRGRSYDRFDGIRWSRSRGVRPSSGAIDWYRAWSDSTIVQKVYGSPLDVHVLFALHPVLEMSAGSDIHPLFDNVGDLIYWGSSAPVYTVRSAASRPSPETLRSAEGAFMPDRRRYLQLPELPGRIHALADSLTRDAGTRYDRVMAVESWLRSGFRYTLDLPDTPREATLDHFLFQRRAGHCEYFSTAMVVLLRSVGIEARNVNGFLGGQWSDVGDYLAVSQNQAHSWVEVWFPGVGWVTFDPTPAGSAAAGAAIAWNWPGRFVFDALQHRWSKWVLDYDQHAQTDLLERLAGSLGEAVSPSGGRDAGDPEGRGIFWVLAVLVVGGVGVALILRRRGEHPPATRLYVRLLQATRRAGAVDDGPIAPLALVERLRARAPAAAEPAGRLVRHYLEARFSGRDPGESDLAPMREALREARRALRGRVR